MGLEEISDHGGFEFKKHYFVSRKEGIARIERSEEYMHIRSKMKNGGKVISFKQTYNYGPFQKLLQRIDSISHFGFSCFGIVRHSFASEDAYSLLLYKNKTTECRYSLNTVLCVVWRLVAQIFFFCRLFSTASSHDEKQVPLFSWISAFRSLLGSESLPVHLHCLHSPRSTCYSEEYVNTN